MWDEVNTQLSGSYEVIMKSPCSICVKQFISWQETNSHRINLSQDWNEVPFSLISLYDTLIDIMRLGVPNQFSLLSQCPHQTDTDVFMRSHVFSISPVSVLHWSGWPSWQTGIQESRPLVRRSLRIIPEHMTTAALSQHRGRVVTAFTTSVREGLCWRVKSMRETPQSK